MACIYWITNGLAIQLDAYTTIYSVRYFFVLYSTMLDVDLSLPQAYRRKTIFSTFCHLVSFSWALSDRATMIRIPFTRASNSQQRRACCSLCKWSFPKSVHMRFHGSNMHVHLPYCKTSPYVTTTMDFEHTVKPHSLYHIPHSCFAI